MGAGTSALSAALPARVDEANAKAVLQDLYSEAVYASLKDSTGMIPQRELLSFLSSATDVFLSHDWGMDELGRSNHERVVRIAEHLKQAGLRVWLDQERMEGDIYQRMVEGIESSRLTLIFVTEAYLYKIAGKGGAGDKDNCLFEFDYAVRSKGRSKMLAGG
jgi:hypothetical protein